jgi:hypothetical protein
MRKPSIIQSNMGIDVLEAAGLALVLLAILVTVGVLLVAFFI